MDKLKHPNRSPERIASALHNDGFRSEFFKDLAQNGLENVFKAFIVVAFVQREVYSVIFTPFGANIINVACTREKIFKFMKRASHHSVC